MSKAPILVACLLVISAAIVLRAAGHEPASELAAAIPLDRASAQPNRQFNDVIVVNSGAKADKLLIASSGSPTKVGRSRATASCADC